MVKWNILQDSIPTFQKQIIIAYLLTQLLFMTQIHIPDPLQVHLLHPLPILLPCTTYDKMSYKLHSYWQNALTFDHISTALLSIHNIDLIAG